MQPWSHSLQRTYCVPPVLHYVLNSPAKFFPLLSQFLLVRCFFVIIVKNARTVCLESFVFVPFASTVLPKSHVEVEDTLQRFYVSVNHQRMPSPNTNFFYNLANAFILLNLRVTRLNFV